MNKGCFYMLVSPIILAGSLVAAMLEGVFAKFGVKSASPPPGFGNPSQAG
jgi:hypothetical protein